MRLDLTNLLPRPRAAYLAIVALFFFVRILFFVGYANVDPWDDTTYLAAAEDARNGAFRQKLEALARWQGAPLAPTVLALLRPAYIMPLALFQAVGGVTELSSALPSLVASFGTLLVIFALGERFSDRKTALLAGLLFAVTPIDVVYSTRILPETLQAFWIALSVLLAARARHALSGLALFIGYLTRAQAVLGLPIALFATMRVWRQPRERFRPLIIVFVFGLGLTAEALYYHLRTGHAFLNSEVTRATVRWAFVSKPEALLRPAPGLVVHSSYEFGGPHHIFKQMLGRIPHYPGVHLFSVFAPAGALAILYALFSRKHALLSVWLVGFLLFVQYGFADLAWERSTRTLHYYLHFPQPRYLESAVVPLVLLVAALLTVLPWRLTVIATAAVAGTALFHALGNHRFYRGSLEDMRAVSRFLERQGQSRVLVDGWGAMEIRFFTRGARPGLELLPLATDAPDGTLVVLGGSRGYDLASQALADSLPPHWRDLHLHPEKAPDAWRRVFHRAGPRHLARASDVFVFAVGAP